MEDVHTAVGNLLLSKGKFVTPREIEILRAFFIKSVVVDQAPHERNADSTEAEEDSPDVPKVYQSNFYKHYEQMLHLIKQVFKNSSAGAALPIFDIRRKIEELLNHLNEYSVLTFVPKEMNHGDYLYHHAIKVSLTSYKLAKWNGWTQKDLIPVAMAGLLHDIGNIKVHLGILLKKGKLTPSEIEEIRRHTLDGYNILKNVHAINEGVRLAALQHHEREDGSGYPLGVKGDKIHAYAKMVAIADVFHAMTSEHPYKGALSAYVALEELSNEAFGKLEPAFVQNFVAKATQFNNGTLVRLSNNSVGEIVFSDRTYPTRPWVKVNGNIINLSTNRSLYIEEVISS